MTKSEQKEHRKPSIKLYKPGKGLQNKVVKSEDVVETENKFCSEETVNKIVKTETVSLTKTEVYDKKEVVNGACDSSRPSRSNKNKRPDIQVYVPKSKLNAAINSEKSTNSSSAKLGEENESSWKRSSSHCDRVSPVAGKSNRKQESETSFKKSSSNCDKVSTVEGKSNRNPEGESSWKKSSSNCDRVSPVEGKSNRKQEESRGLKNNRSSPVREAKFSPISSWADAVEEQISNSRSSPECNAYKDTNVHLHLSNPRFSNVNLEKGNGPVNKDQQLQRNSKTAKTLTRNVAKSCSDSHSNYPNKSFELVNRAVSSNNYSNERKTHSVHTNLKQNVSNREGKCGINLNERKTHKPIKKDKHVEENGNSFSQLNEANGNAIERNREKKKREVVLPPRFQKQNLHDSDSIPNRNGIIKIPLEQTSFEPPVDKLYIPKLFPEPQKMFIHKQLFDPNNPNEPEIINIPAPIPPPHPSFNKMNPMFFGSDHFITAPVDSVSHIPPPHPPPSIPPPRPAAAILHNRCFQSGFSHPNAFIDRTVHQSSQFNGILPPHPAYVDEHQKKRLKPIVEKNLQEIVLLEKELTSLLTQDSKDNFNNLKQCRWKLQLRYENIILADPKYSAEKNPEQSLWKTVYHQIIEAYRKRLEDKPDVSEETRDILLNIILEGTLFYENLLEKQQETFGFKLSDLLQVQQIDTSELSDQLRTVLISVQKNLIYLGDLARYKEQVSQTTNYGRARSWYLKAQLIAPKNGKPYHQLALLALTTKRRLDSVYYYVRSLTASNPFLSAKESLLSLFEEAKKKYETYEKQQNLEDKDAEILECQTTKRHEVWIKNDGSSSQRLAEVDNSIDCCDLKKLSDVELNKSFITSFLHVHGKLFTKVGMETFASTLNNMLKEFYVLLQRTPLPLNSCRLIQLLAINIFSVSNTSARDCGREGGVRSLLQEQALYTSKAMMSLIMDRCSLLLIADNSVRDVYQVPQDFSQLLPSVKIWTDWMSCQRSFWSPPSEHLVKELNVQVKINVWDSFANLLSVLQEIDISGQQILTENMKGSEQIMLEEDISFNGFVPLFGAIQNSFYVMVPYDKDRVKNCIRISKIRFFGDYLCGISPPYLEYNVESKKFVAVVETSSEEIYEGSNKLSSTDSSEEELLTENLQEGALSHEFMNLWSRKEALSKVRAKQKKYQAQVQAVLHKHQNQRPIVLKIKPRYLVPDTNCFIDHLNLFKNILASTDFILIIPLVVINELDGLAKGTRVKEQARSEHSAIVTDLAREAIHFLEQQFASRQPHLRAITSKGNLLETISFRSEEIGQNKGTNDDLILTCCLSYCKDRAENYMPKHSDEPISLFREVVLLTEDRNLRVKALAHHVPVRDLLSFLQWANS